MVKIGRDAKKKRSKKHLVFQKLEDFKNLPRRKGYGQFVSKIKNGKTVGKTIVRFPKHT